jgi:DNA-binding GntR family transcriptional regulator
MILSRELVAGQRITQAELSERLGVSVMPVREALFRLVTEGMIDAFANRAFAVSDTMATADSVRDNYLLISLVAGELTARACDNRTPALLEDLERHHVAYAEASRLGRAEESFAINWDFHASLNAAAASPALIRGLRQHMAYFPGFFYEIEGWSALAHEWQAGVIWELRAGSRERARSVVADSVSRAGELFISKFWNEQDGAAE